MGTVALLGVGGCEFPIDDWRHIDGPQLLAVHIEVVELGPLYPERLDAPLEVADPAQLGPIAEGLPGDRVRISAMVADADGSVLDPAQVDAIWFQCGWTGCVNGLAAAGRDCAELEWTTDSECRLGRGGALEFEFPAFGPQVMRGFVPFIRLYGVIAVAESISAEQCLDILLAPDRFADGCVYAIRELGVGPSWLAIYEAALQGLEVRYPIYEIPAGAFAQAPNRSPKPALVMLTSTTEPTQYRVADFEGPAIPLTRGREYDISLPLGSEQVFVRATAVAGTDAYVYGFANEAVGVQWFVTGGLAVEQELNIFPPIASIRVPPDAEPEPARVFAVFADTRGAEWLTWFDVEVR